MAHEEHEVPPCNRQSYLDRIGISRCFAGFGKQTPILGPPDRSKSQIYSQFERSLPFLDNYILSYLQPFGIWTQFAALHFTGAIPIIDRINDSGLLRKVGKFQLVQLVVY